MLVDGCCLVEGTIGVLAVVEESRTGADVTELATFVVPPLTTPWGIIFYVHRVCPKKCVAKQSKKVFDWKFFSLIDTCQVLQE